MSACISVHSGVTVDMNNLTALTLEHASREEDHRITVQRLVVATSENGPLHNNPFDVEQSRIATEYGRGTAFLNPCFSCCLFRTQSTCERSPSRLNTQR